MTKMWAMYFAEKDVIINIVENNYWKDNFKEWIDEVK